jgi:hypothetical protein
MSRDTQLKERWEQLVNILSNQFSQGRRFRRHYLLNWGSGTWKSTPRI